MFSIIEHLTEEELRTTMAIEIDHGNDVSAIMAELAKRETKVAPMSL